MPATPSQELIGAAQCYFCLGMTQAEALLLALWDRIAQNGPVLSFIVRAGITDATQISALNTLVLAAKTNGWWDKCDLIYPFVGGNATAHAQNLKSSQFMITWFGAVTHDANGITGDGATGHGNTGYVPQLGGRWHQNNAHLSAYLRTLGTLDKTGWFGCGSAGINAELGFTLPAIATLAINSNTNVVMAIVIGYLMGARLSANQTKGYAGVIENTQNNNSNGVPTQPLTIIADNVNGTAGNFSDANLAAATAGSGLTFAEYTLMAADFQAFQTALGRQV